MKHRIAQALIRLAQRLDPPAPAPRPGSYSLEVAIAASRERLDKAQREYARQMRDLQHARLPR
ncbi:hypothetical protein KL864_27110 [Mycolicibacterium goodii]|uniref:hypothetical protein n=1 Tax=Mycolicibacterium goodii TaxID=134601 RepID=UPI001BDC45B2|nr:hypothetical protein [Mycolicibacterium goodii]MBU8819560.1 hypothetical protein [Mycolicibacterium goodii]